MPTVDIRITSMYPPGQSGGIRAYASATIDGCFGVKGIKIVEGKNGLFVSMPSRKTTEGYKEICMPVTAEFRSKLYTAITDAYQNAIRAVMEQGTAAEADQYLEAPGGQDTELPMPDQTMPGM